MAMPAAVVVVIKKVAVDLLLKKKTWIAIASVIAGIVALCLLPVIVLLSMSSEMSEMKGDKHALQQKIISNLTEEQKEKLLYFETVMTAIGEEIAAQGLDINPIKAEVIYMCVLMDKERDNDNFYKDYISCFAAEDDNQVFANISEKFGVQFTDEEKRNIITLYTNTIKSQNPSSSEIP